LGIARIIKPPAPEGGVGEVLKISFFKLIEMKSIPESGSIKQTNTPIGG
jgi:hypothetical protein